MPAVAAAVDAASLPLLLLDCEEDEEEGEEEEEEEGRGSKEKGWTKEEEEERTDAGIDSEGVQKCVRKSYFSSARISKGATEIHRWCGAIGTVQR